MNKLFRKSISVILGAALTVTSSVCAFAQDIETMDVSSYNWDSSLVSGEYTKLYEEFPMKINKSLGAEMSLSMQFMYMKTITDNDSVSVSISDMTDGSEINNYQLTNENKYIVWNDVDNDKAYVVSIVENLNGIETMYDGYINTKYVPADFPVNIKIGNMDYARDNGEAISAIAMKKVGEFMECSHDPDEECTEECAAKNNPKVYKKEQFQTFYSELDSDCFYELQATDSEGTRYQGFISTFYDGENLGIFTRGYEFTTNPISAHNVTNISNYSATATSVSPSNFDFSKAYDYVYYRDEYISELDYSSNLIVKWTVPESAKYTIEMIGNLDTMFYEFTINPKTGGFYDSVYTRTAGGTGENAAKTLSISQGMVKYFVLNLESGTPGPCAFRIIRNSIDDSDMISAYRSEVQKNYDNGIFSSALNPNCAIEFDGDVNIFAFNATEGYSYLEFKSVEMPLIAEIYTIYDRVGGLDQIWRTETIDVINGEERIMFGRTSEKRIYYVDIRQALMPDIGSDEYYDGNCYSYEFYYYDPSLRDTVESSASPSGYDSGVYPVEISIPYRSYSSTLSNGDSDYFAFTTGNDGGQLNAKLYKTSNDLQYNITLFEDIEIFSYDPPEWSESDPIGAVTTNDSYKELTYDNLLPNHKYYIWISRPDRNTYSSAHPYGLEIDIVVPRAALDGDVIISKNSEENITNLSSLKNSLLDHMTCTIDGRTVSKGLAIADVELYYNDALLTSDIVNSLEVGTYTIVPKYKGVVATGGTVTLDVYAPTHDRVEITIPTATQFIQEYDWLYCAKALADFRLSKDGLPESTLEFDEIADRLGVDPDNPSRGTLYQTYKATCLFYSNGTATSNSAFARVTNSNVVTEDELYNMVSNNRIVIMQLADSTAKSDWEKQRYVIICGVDKTSHSLKVYDCLKTSDKLLEWVKTTKVFDGGYDSANVNVKFSGSIIEVTN